MKRGEEDLVIGARTLYDEDEMDNRTCKRRDDGGLLVLGGRPHLWGYKTNLAVVMERPYLRLKPSV